jgi:hypothetical protein
MHMAFDPLEPFADKSLLDETMGELGRFKYKLYGQIPLKLHRGEPTVYEFDLNLGVIHFTEQDFKGLSEIFERINKKWGTRMTYCIYPSKDAPREIIMNVRGSPKAPSEID